jgi:hypothetical protein
MWIVLGVVLWLLGAAVAALCYELLRVPRLRTTQREQWVANVAIEKIRLRLDELDAQVDRLMELVKMGPEAYRRAQDLEQEREHPPPARMLNAKNAALPTQAAG